MRSLYRLRGACVLVTALLLSTAPVAEAEGLNTLLELYEIPGAVSTGKVYKKMSQLQEELDNMSAVISEKEIKEGAYNEFLLTYTAFLESTDEELRMIEIDLTQAELLMSESRNKPLGEILKLDSVYRNLRHNHKQLMERRELLSQQFNNVAAVRVTTEELDTLADTTKEYEEVKNEYADLVKEDDLGEILGRHPVDNEMFITSTFGWRSNPINGVGLELHKGIDFRGTIGTPVISKYNGVVIKTGKNSLSGNYVWVDHGGTVQTVYAHLDSVSVEKGQEVSQYQEVGKLGTTGRSTGPHLHFGLYINGDAVDPALTIQ